MPLFIILSTDGAGFSSSDNEENVSKFLVGWKCLEVYSLCKMFIQNGLVYGNLRHLSYNEKKKKKKDRDVLLYL